MLEKIWKENSKNANDELNMKEPPNMGNNLISDIVNPLQSAEITPKK